jgi:glycosyltransferase involved in cell wall biosynthesis
MSRTSSAPPPPQPYFANSASPAFVRRLLLITMAFPPDQSIGALRWEKLAKYVAERGWGLDVVTIDPSCLQSPDPRRLDELPCGVRAYGVPPATSWIDRMGPVAHAVNRWVRARRGAAGISARPASLNRAEMRWTFRNPRELVRAYHTCVDYARTRRWAREAASLALRLVEPGVHRAIVTTGPPHMAHEAGRLVARATDLPLVLDMRDPWSLVQRLPEDLASPIYRRLAAWYERRAVAQAALVAANTEPFRLAMCERYPDARERLLTVMNGCDEPVPASRHGTRFVIAYAGTVYLDRDPRLLFRATGRVIHELALGPSQIGIEFMGQMDEFWRGAVAEIAREEGVAPFLSLHSPRPRREALEFLAEATLLVSLPQDSDMAIPGKIFEYLQFDAWVLALTTPESATGRLLEGTAAHVVAPDDLDGMASVIGERYRQFTRGTSPTRVATNGRFSRREQARRLLDAIDACTRRRHVGLTEASER